MKYVYGPVVSRRLGQSLGIDPISLKTCNWNCVYCQLGRSRPVTNRRKAYIPTDAILAEVEAALDAHSPDEIDWVTFVGSGEPSLHAKIGELIRQVKALTDKPVAVITNGALLYLPEVRGAVAAADAVLPSLDAGNPSLYRRINRPHPAATFQRLLDGLIAFREMYQGKLWLEIMLLRGLNSTDAALQEIANLIFRIRPDEVHLNTPVRPPAETWVQPPTPDEILLAMAVLGGQARVVHPAQGRFVLGDREDALQDILGILTRHPLREDELKSILAQGGPGQAEKVMKELTADGWAQIVERNGVRFWSAAPAFYPEASDRSAVPENSPS